MLYLTGSGLSPKRIPLLLACPQIGVLATPVSLHLLGFGPDANLPRLVRWMERLGVTMSLPL